MDAASVRRPRWRSWLPQAFGSRSGRMLAAAYYVLYAAPVASGVRIDPLLFHWMLSAAALATAVIWLCERGGAARGVALAVNAVSSLANLLLLASLYIQGEGFNAQFFEHVDWETLVVGSRAFAALCVGAAAWWLLVGLWPWLLAPAARRGAVGPGPRPRVVALVLAGAVAMNGATLSLCWHAATALVAGNRIVLVPKRPRDVVPSGTARPRDLVVVVAESLEATFGRADVVGEDLTPGLTALAAEGLRFTDMRQVSNTGWTMGALAASWCAEPMLSMAWQELVAYRRAARMPGRICLGDVLAAEGYRGVLMVGHPLTFTGVGRFYGAHGVTELLGLQALAPAVADAEYRTGWGLYDDSLLELARAKAAELAASETPFVLVVLTMDTHFPPGSPSRSCGPVGGDEPTSFVVRCADRLLAAFIRDVRSMLPDAVIVLYSDHLAKRAGEDLLRQRDGGGTHLEEIPSIGWRRILGLADAGDDSGSGGCASRCGIRPAARDGSTVRERTSTSCRRFWTRWATRRGGGTASAHRSYAPEASGWSIRTPTRCSSCTTRRTCNCGPGRRSRSRPGWGVRRLR